MSTINIPPDMNGIIRWARQVFAESETAMRAAEVEHDKLAASHKHGDKRGALKEAELHNGSKEAARQVLAECNEMAYDIGTPVYVTVTDPETGATTEVAGIVRKNGSRTALVRIEGENLPVSVAYDVIRATEE